MWCTSPTQLYMYALYRSVSSITIVLASDHCGSAECVSSQTGELDDGTGRIYLPVFAFSDDLRSQVVRGRQQRTLHCTKIQRRLMTTQTHKQTRDKTDHKHVRTKAEAKDSAGEITFITERSTKAAIEDGDIYEGC